MKEAVAGVFVALALFSSLKVEAREKAVYVGEGRFYGEEQESTATAILKQRNQEQTLRAQERNREEERYERAERRKREHEREMTDDFKPY